MMDWLKARSPSLQHIELLEVGAYARAGAYRRMLSATSMTFYEII